MKLSDYIERDVALQIVFVACAECISTCEEFDGIYADCHQCPLEGVKLKLRDLPFADVRPVVRGKWGYRWKVHGDGRRPTELFPCSVCGFENTCVTNFCPSCGADMRGGEDDGV